MKRTILSTLVLGALVCATFAQLPAVSAQSNVAPVAVIEPGVTSGTAPLASVFDGSASNDVDGTIVDYGWDFGDGAVGSGVSTSHAYTVSGVYQVVLTVTDDMGATATDDLAITVTEPPPNQPPVAVIEPGVTSGIAPLDAPFDGSASADVDGLVVAHEWDFGDGSTAAGVSPQHTYGDVGSFEVVLTVTDDDGATATDSVTVSVAGPIMEPRMEAGVVVGVTDAWQTVTLADSYTSAVVVASVQVPDAASDPVVARVRNAAGASFELKVQATDGAAAGAFDVQFFVVEEGVYTAVEHGITMEAVRTVSRRTARRGRWRRERRGYANLYVEPVVVGQVMSDNDQAWSVFWASAANDRRLPPSATSFAAGKHVGEDPVTGRGDETIGYIVIEAGVTVVGGLSLEAGNGADVVRGVDRTPATYVLAGTQQPSVAVVGSIGMGGGNGGWPVLFGADSVAADQLTLAYNEDIAADAERTHSAERVAYVVLSGSQQSK